MREPQRQSLARHRPSSSHLPDVGVERPNPWQARVQRPHVAGASPQDRSGTYGSFVYADRLACVRLEEPCEVRSPPTTRPPSPSATTRRSAGCYHVRFSAVSHRCTACSAVYRRGDDRSRLVDSRACCVPERRLPRPAGRRSAVPERFRCHTRLRARVLRVSGGRSDCGTAAIALLRISCSAV